MFHRVFPWSFYLLASYSLVCIAGYLQYGFNAEQFAWDSCFLLVVISPFIYGEYSASTIELKYYYPSFFGLLLLCGNFVFKITIMFPDYLGHIILGFGIALMISVVWNVTILSKDIYPALFANRDLEKLLKSLQPSKIFTYDTSFNNTFAEAMKDEQFYKSRVKYVESMREADEGLFLVPPVTCKSIVQPDSSGGNPINQNFSSDALLNELLRSREITEVAVKDFRTLASSRFISLDGCITAFRDLIFKDIKAEDRWLGRGWVLDVGKLQRWIQYRDAHK